MRSASRDQTPRSTRSESLFVNGVSCCFWIFLLGLRLGSFSAPTRLGWLIGQLADELPGHDHGGGPQQHGLVMLGQPLVVTDQTPVPVQPTETAFHDPPPGKHDEPADVVGAFGCGRCVL